MVSFAMQKLLSFIRSHLFIFVFISITLGGGSKTSCCDLCQRVFFLFSSKSFIVSSFTFRSFIHFEFIFVYSVRECSNFIPSHVAVQFSQHHLLKSLQRPYFENHRSKTYCLRSLENRGMFGKWFGIR